MQIFTESLFDFGKHMAWVHFSYFYGKFSTAVLKSARRFCVLTEGKASMMSSTGMTMPRCISCHSIQTTYRDLLRHIGQPDLDEKISNQVLGILSAIYFAGLDLSQPREDMATCRTRISPTEQCPEIIEWRFVSRTTRPKCLERRSV